MGQSASDYIYAQHGTRNHYHQHVKQSKKYCYYKENNITLLLMNTWWSLAHQLTGIYTRPPNQFQLRWWNSCGKMMLIKIISSLNTKLQIKIILYYASLDLPPGAATFEIQYTIYSYRIIWSVVYINAD